MPGQIMPPAKPPVQNGGHSAVPAKAPITPEEGFPVVGIGASAGGLVACRRLLDAMPDGQGMAFILVQHLDPNHESLMVDLLAGHTRMIVRQATNGMLVQPDHLYAIPPGVYLAVRNGELQLSEPSAPHGARLPFDFLLHSMADEYGPRAVCVVLSGSGSDGSIGLQAISRAHGFIIAQKPEEAEFDGMPRSAIKTGDVDIVLPVADIPEAIRGYATFLAETPQVNRKVDAADVASNDDVEADGHQLQQHLGQIIDLLRTQTVHDFTLYKPGTLQRRVDRRMAMVSLPAGSIGRYLDMLHQTPAELELLAKDLLIHVTSFFRDPEVFDLLSSDILPGLLNRRDNNEPLRLWVAGCSTGEETYSLAMLLIEQLEASKRVVKLQLFASDIDAEAIAIAREGVYPSRIADQVSAERLARFFNREGTGYRVLPELRSIVVFTVQDVLADPPFSRLDMISCRNLLIYLRPEAQAKVISIFHFALRQDGILLLGNAETVSSSQGFFEVINKTARIYRHVARGGPGETNIAISSSDAQQRTRLRLSPGRIASRTASLADLCRRLVLEAYAPAAILINSKHECLYSLGPIHRYLRMAPGLPNHDVLEMSRPGMRTQLREAIKQAGLTKKRVISGGHVSVHGDVNSFNIEVHPVHSDELDLLLLCFIDIPTPEAAIHAPVSASEHPRIAELEHLLEISQTDLHNAIRSLEISGEEQSEINEEALSVNEEYQSTNEELLASKEELQSLNEELTALNAQLQETLERQRTTANDLQNVLFSTDVATLFLDTDLNIRFFTPATRALFNVIPGDIGRPIDDLNSLAIHGSMPDEARAVMAGAPKKELEVQMPNGIWFSRRILPYRTHENTIAGVVITFTNITERKRVAKDLEQAKLAADIANHAKSRFLAAASHDLRQPLQTLALLSGVLAKTVVSAPSKALVARLDEALGGISGMLNTLLDINEIETGSVNAEMCEFPINTLLDRLRDQFSFHAEAQHLKLHVVPCSAEVLSDPRLLEQMIRNLLANALKYTSKGKVLLGCRRHPGMLSIEVWDTGIGIPEHEHKAIFDEYHQINNAARERSRGLGLGLSIVQQLGKFLGHTVRVRSEPGKGSCFSIEILMPVLSLPTSALAYSALHDIQPMPPGHRTADILLIEDDLSVRDLLAQLLASEGHKITAVSDGIAAITLVKDGSVSPDLILTDYNLPNGMDGVKVTAALRGLLARRVPVIVLTGDISKETLRHIASHDCVQLNKPIKPAELSTVIQRLLPLPGALPPPVLLPAPAPAPEAAAPAARPHPAISPDAATIFVIDDDKTVRDAMRMVFELEGYAIETFGSAEEFLSKPHPQTVGCLLIDAYLPGMDGLDLLKKLTAEKHHLPSIMITGRSDVGMAVEAMKSGASDFIDKPVGTTELLDAVARALERARDSSKALAWQENASQHIAGLTERQRQVMEMVLAGHPSKNIAADLGISQRTVENHRASIMRKTGSKSLPALARLALAAGTEKAG
jgi:two-component system CheB/CheR fusion protein